MKQLEKIQICPAILESDDSKVSEQLEKYSQLFDQIDIDINIENDEFDGKVTLSIEKTLEIIKSRVKPSTTIAFHLMTSSPEVEIAKITSAKLTNKLKFYIHQESNTAKVIQNYLAAFYVGITIKAESELKKPEYYKQFKEVQLMTIETGSQGKKLKPEILSRVEWLREEGYSGEISIDGGVNINTANLIKKYDLNRVSVGSYFSKSTDLVLDYQKLNLALNMGRI